MAEYDHIIKYRVYGEDFPLYVKRNCKTCNHPQRPFIENMILYGYGWNVIASELVKDDRNTENPLSAKNIQSHYEAGHMTTPATVKRAILEKRAAQKNIDSHSSISIADPFAMTQVGLQAAFEALQRGDIKFDAKDLISFIKLQSDMEERLSEGPEVTSEHIVGMLEKAKKFMTSDQWSNFMDELDTDENPVTQALPAAPTADDEIEAEILTTTINKED